MARFLDLGFLALMFVASILSAVFAVIGGDAPKAIVWGIFVIAFAFLLGGRLLYRRHDL